MISEFFDRRQSRGTHHHSRFWWVPLLQSRHFAHTWWKNQPLSTTKWSPRSTFRTSVCRILQLSFLIQLWPCLQQICATCHCTFRPLHPVRSGSPKPVATKWGQVGDVYRGQCTIMLKSHHESRDHALDCISTHLQVSSKLEKMRKCFPFVKPSNQQIQQKTLSLTSSSLKPHPKTSSNPSSTIGGHSHLNAIFPSSTLEHLTSNAS